MDAPFTSKEVVLDPRMQEADALLIVPPFARLDMPHLGLHLLQACAKRAGFDVRVLYTGIAFAGEIGADVYDAMCSLAEVGDAARYGERLFARAAYGVPLLGRNAESILSAHHEVGYGSKRRVLDHALLKRIALHAEGWVERMAEAITSRRCPVVGFSSMFEQTAACVALIRRIKERAPSTRILFGGPNAFGDMAEGIALLCPDIDHVFSGESERIFPTFLAGKGHSERVIRGEPCMDLDSLPTPDYTDYYAQWRACFGEVPEALGQMLLPYESSRGCWWGQKHHCTFCGVAVMRFREKSADRVIEELRHLLGRHPSRNVFNTDDIMPHSYFKTLIPRLRSEMPGLSMFYEQKANLTLDKVVALHGAGVSVIQPGIEALSSSLLRRMDKGLLARQNIALLRYARSVLLNLLWSLLYGFPGDLPEDYAHYPALLPLLRHLEPPRFFAQVRLLRFSPYSKWPERYGIDDLRPRAAYADLLPDGFDASRIAYVFDGAYESVATRAPALVDSIRQEVLAWQRAWEVQDGTLPTLSIRRMASDEFLIIDTRGLPGALPVQGVTRKRAVAALVGHTLARPGELASEMEWAVRSRYAVQLDGWHVPLATADPNLIAEFEAEFGHHDGALESSAVDRSRRLSLVD